VMACVQRIDLVASHASWMESFAWTRVAGATPPDVQKPLIDFAALAGRDPQSVRAMIGDGNYGGRYQRADAEMDELWRAAVAETRELIAQGWS
jgi:creatinine amidohydrolase